MNISPCLKYILLFLFGITGIIFLSYALHMGFNRGSWLVDLTELLILFFSLIVSVVFLYRIHNQNKALYLTQEELSHSYEMLKYIIEHNSCAVAVLDENLRYIYVSERYVEDFKIKEKKIIGKHHYEVFPNLPEKWREVDQRVLKGEICRCEDDLTVTEDSQEWTNRECRPWYKRNGEIGGIILYVEFITERKKNEKKLQDREQLYSSLFHKNKAVFFLFDVHSLKIIDANQAACEFYGWNHQEMIQKSILDINTLSIEEINRTKQKVLREEKNHYYFHHRLANGDIREVEVYTGPINIDGKELIYSMVYDITEKKKIEKQLHESQELFTTIIKASPDLIVISDVKGQFLTVSQVSGKMFGIESTEGIGHSFTDFIIPEDCEKAKNALMQRMQGNYTGSTQFKGVHANGSLFDIEVNTDFIRDGQGNPVKIVFIVRDISQRIKTEEELIRAKEKAEESDRLKSAFLANMSHEIRTPMNGILGFAGLLKESKLTGEERDEYLTIIEKSGERLLNIINDIVEISKIESGTTEVKLVKTNILEQLEYIGKFFRPEADKKGIRLVIKNSLSAKGEILETDTEKLYAVLINLVKNAIKYSDQGTIEIGCVKKDGLLEFYVDDTGIGIPEEQQELIFNRFVQAENGNRRTFEGAGLGLAISKAYVEMLGGKIWLKSKAGLGSTFYFTIPCNNNFYQEVNQALPGKIDLHQSLKILIAEDDRISLNLLKKLLGPFSQELLYAPNGKEAVRICKENPDLHLIFMDIKMPEMDGYEATRLIRVFNQEVLIIAQTAFALSYNREEALHCGCTDYISKPVKKEDLNSLILKYFGNQEVLPGDRQI